MTTILLLSLLILLHEFGHYIVAKLFGVKVEEFGIGIPPKALKLFTWRETEFTFNWLPLGGFVRLAGEEHDPSLWEKINPFLRKKMFFAKPAWQRALVIIAGVVMNFVVGIAAFSIIYSVNGVPEEVGEQVMISQVLPNSPAAQADLVTGEVVYKIDDTEIKTSAEFVELIKERKGQNVSLWVAKVDVNGERGEESRVVSVIPRENPPEGEGALGVAVSTVPIFQYKKLQIVF